jgi:hypothetical protein
MKSQRRFYDDGQVFAMGIGNQIVVPHRLNAFNLIDRESHDRRPS